MLAPARAFAAGRLQDPLLATFAFLTALVTGWAVVRMPAAAVSLAAGTAGLLLLVSPRARVLFVVFGVILAFGTSDELTTTKLLYLVGLAAAVAGAVAHVQTLTRTPAFVAFRPLVWAAIALAGLVVISFPVAVLTGSPPKDWLRDSAPYVMTATAPLFALDAYASFSKRALERIVAAAGLLGALAFAVQWLARRGIGTLGLETIGFPTILLGAALFAYAMSAVIQGRRRWPWMALGALTFGLLISTGTRTSFVLLAAPLAIVVGSRRQLLRRSIRLAVALPLVAALIATSAVSVLKAVDADETAVQGRISVLFRTGGQTDHSYVERLNSTRAAWDAFRSAPLLGVGPGAPFTWKDAIGVQHTERQMDTPVLFLARFGLVGLGWVAFFIAALVTVTRRLARANPVPTVSQLALVGFGAIVAADAILLVPFEDKGFSAALLVLSAVALREAFGKPGATDGR